MDSVSRVPGLEGAFSMLHVIASCGKGVGWRGHSRSHKRVSTCIVPCTVCHQNGRVQKSETLQEDSTTSDQEALFTACQSSTRWLRVNGRTLNYGEDEVLVGCSEPAENDAGCWALIADKTMNLLKREQLVVVIPLSLSRWRWCTKAECCSSWWCWTWFVTSDDCEPPESLLISQSPSVGYYGSNERRGSYSLWLNIRRPLPYAPTTFWNDMICCCTCTCTNY